MENPELRILHADGLDLAAWDWPGGGAPIVFAHATGFHGRCWDQIARQFPGHRRIAVDFRGHGRSSKPEPPYSWRSFAKELAEVVEGLGVSGALAVGHSMGGHSVVGAASLKPELFSSLLLVDPTIFPPELYGPNLFDSSFVERRRNQWQSADEMFERFRNRPPFAGWQPEVLRDYCEYGLLPGENGLVLACPPNIEASIYRMSLHTDSSLYAEIPLLRQPVLVMRAGIPYRPGVLDLYASPTAPDLASKFPNGRDLLLDGRNHFIPMESPDLVAEAIRNSLPTEPVENITSGCSGLQ